MFVFISAYIDAPLFTQKNIETDGAVERGP